MRRTVAVIALAALVACGAPAATAPSPSPTPTRSPTPTPTPTPSPTPSPSPSVAPAESYFVDGPVTFVALPAALEAQVLAGAQNDAVRAFVKSTAVRTVTKNGEATGSFVMVMALEPAVAALPGMMDGFVGGIRGAAPGAFNNPETTTIGGRTVTVLFHSEQKLWYMMWLHKHFIVLEFAATRAAAEEVAGVLISANR